MSTRAAVLCAATAVMAASLAGAPAAPAEAGTARAAEPFHAAAPAWRDCGTDDYPTLQCASVEVPLDHADPTGRTITLAVSRVPHTAKTFQGPLLVNPGGPGGSGLTLAGFVASSLPEKVAAQYDIIGFDPRGVGRSEPSVTCVPGHFGPVRPDPVPTSPEVEQANLERVRSFAAACGRRYGALLPHLGTAAGARDIEVIRQALGAERINYFGYSYGTYLGAVYAKLFPERVRRLVLDSVVDPTAVWYDANLQQNDAFNDRHRAFMTWVAGHDSAYRLGTDPEKVEAAWYAMRAALKEEPAGGMVGAAELEDTYLPGGYYDGYWPYLAEAFSAYVNDDDAGPLIVAYENFGANDAAGDNGYSVYTAVECRDASWPRDWQQWRKDMWESYARAPFLTWNNTWYNAPCAFWPAESLRPERIRNSALPPALLFQATHDAATPYQGALTVHRLLSGSSLVVESGGGNHGITLSGNACLDRHLAAYLLDGTVPRGGEGEADAVCAALPGPHPLTSKAAPHTAPGTKLHGLLGFRG